MSSNCQRDRKASGRLTDGVDLVLILAAAALLLAPSIAGGVPKGYDYPFHAVWTEAFTDRMMQGDLYPRWLDGLWLGAGGADFFFYAPLPFWTMGLVRIGACPGCNADGLLLAAGLIFLTVSGLGFRALARQFAGRWAANFAAVIYMALPYHLDVDWYSRIAIGEFAAMAFLPWHLAAFLDCMAGRRSGVRLAVFSALLALCHLPTLIIVAIGYLSVLLFAARPDGWRGYAALLTAGVVGLGLAMIYWLPAVTLLDSVRSELLSVPALSWRRYILLPQNFGRSLAYDSLWPPFAVLSLATLVALFTLPREYRAPARVCAALLAAVWVMVTPLSVLIWESTPVSRVQFPPRFMMLSDLAFALAALMLIETMIRGVRAHQFRRRLSGGVLALFAFVIALEHPFLSSNDDRYVAPNDPIELSAGTFEWLPSETRDTFGRQSYWDLYDMARQLRTHPEILLPGVGQARVISSTSRSMSFETDLPEQGTVVLRRTFWRYWQLHDLDSKERIELKPTGEFPLIEVQLPAGRHRYLLELPTLRAERFGALISLAALMVLLVWAWFSRRPTES